MYRLREDLIGIRHPVVWQYLLIDGESVVSIDAGMGLAAWRVKRWFARSGRAPEQLKAILLTHGHLDHAGCAERLRQWSGAETYMHPADAPIIRGRFGYRGWARVCGTLEALGRPLTGYRLPRIDHSLEDGQVLPFWGGLRVIHLPGHTPGHLGFYSAKKKILFAGDSILAPFGSATFPLSIFNVDDRQVRDSVLRIADLDCDWIYPMHHRLLRRNLMPGIRRYAEARRSTDAGRKKGPQ